MKINRITKHAKEEAIIRKISLDEVKASMVIMKAVDKKHEGRFQCFLSTGIVAVVDGNDNLVTVYYERKRRLHNIFRGCKVNKNVSCETFANAYNLMRQYESEGRNYWKELYQQGISY